MTAQALKRFTAMAEQAQAHCDKFAADFAKDPSHALSWGLNVFQNAARLKVAQMMINAFAEEREHKCTIEDARETLMDRVMNKARYPAQSTSPTSNLMEQYEAAAYAEALDVLKYL